MDLRLWRERYTCKWMQLWHSPANHSDTMKCVFLIPPCCSAAKSYQTLLQLMDCGPPGSSILGILQVRIVGCHFLPKGIFWTDGPCLLHWQADHLPLSHQGSQLIFVILIQLNFYFRSLLPCRSGSFIVLACLTSPKAALPELVSCGNWGGCSASLVAQMIRNLPVMQEIWV